MSFFAPLPRMAETDLEGLFDWWAHVDALKHHLDQAAAHKRGGKSPRRPR